MCIRSGPFAKLLRRRPFHSFLARCISHRGTRLPIGMSDRATCGWSQVHIDSGLVALCGPVPFAVTDQEYCIWLHCCTCQNERSIWIYRWILKSAWLYILKFNQVWYRCKGCVVPASIIHMDWLIDSLIGWLVGHTNDFAELQLTISNVCMHAQVLSK